MSPGQKCRGVYILSAAWTVTDKTAVFGVIYIINYMMSGRTEIQWSAYPILGKRWSKRTSKACITCRCLPLKAKHYSQIWPVLSHTQIWRALSHQHKAMSFLQSFRSSPNCGSISILCTHFGNKLWSELQGGDLSFWSPLMFLVSKLASSTKQPVLLEKDTALYQKHGRRENTWTFVLKYLHAVLKKTTKRQSAACQKQGTLDDIFFPFWNN